MVIRGEWCGVTGMARQDPRIDEGITTRPGLSVEMATFMRRNIDLRTISRSFPGRFHRLVLSSPFVAHPAEYSPLSRPVTHQHTENRSSLRRAFLILATRSDGVIAF